jgi:hypothetical protein
MLAEEWETDGSLYTVVYCPECAVREFGGDRPPAESF